MKRFILVLALTLSASGCNAVRHLTGLDSHDAPTVDIAQGPMATMVERPLFPAPAAIAFHPDTIDAAPNTVRVFVKTGYWLDDGFGAWYEIPWATAADGRATEYAVINFTGQVAVVYNQPVAPARAILVQSIPPGATDPGQPPR